jgi:hypothetical protein
MKSQVNDCLKYWRVIRYFIKAKYGLSTADLDMLLFLYSEEIFSKKKFEEFDNLLIWDGERFNRLYKEGWIEVFRNRKKTTKSLYTLSYKTERVISGIYKKAFWRRNTNLFIRQSYVCKECKVYRQSISQYDSTDE